MELSSLEIGLYLFLPIYSTAMLIERSEAFMVYCLNFTS